MQIINEADQFLATFGLVLLPPVPLQTVQHLTPNHARRCQLVAIDVQQVSFCHSRLAKPAQKLLQHGSLPARSPAIHQDGLALADQQIHEMQGRSCAGRRNERQVSRLVGGV